MGSKQDRDDGNGRFCWMTKQKYYAKFAKAQI